ncbi:hypothetical protein [Poseidonocella sedimentorum]|uniref:Uncharacterized protein n=1 Tax=Poseidonocella sedimentorum TaxID=871652 RepID=A0A1I6EAW8_9RHOB|nr:hypothetical protein [Poseidonocella sedimentorum]SFR14880.1 hypothetical protein SAMN04515673_10948 [Poseidonocella sedimentorum]
MFRPEAMAQIKRWREVLAGTALVVLGLFWAIGRVGLLSWVGWGLVLLGVALGFAGIQRARFFRATGGPGVVDLDEGQVTYLGPVSGGAVALRSLSRLDLDPSGHPAQWVLYQPGQPALHIPVNATGAEALFDAFATLPGLRTERMLAELKAGRGRVVTIWTATHYRLH